MTTLGGALVLMLVKDWTLKAVVTSLLAWPALAAAMLVGMLMALLPLGRVYFWSAVGGGLLVLALGLQLAHGLGVLEPLSQRIDQDRVQPVDAVAMFGQNFGGAGGCVSQWHSLSV